MYPYTNNLGNSTATNTPTPDYLPNNNNTVDIYSTTYLNSSSSSFNPIHSPYIFYEEDPFLPHFHDQYFFHQQQQPQPPPIVAQETAVTSMEKHTDEHVPISTGGVILVKGSHVVDNAVCNNSNQIPRKRTSKKDRHSKINTAHGPRDRRMRLSLDVAQKFFGLQDMLGFDKASKTVQWLLTKSKTAIKQLTNSTRAGNVSNTTSASSTSNNSECEVLSGIIDDSSLSLPQEITAMDKAKTAAAAREKKAATTKGARFSRAFHPLAKETREKARARARERTVEKRIRLGKANYYDNQAKKIPCIEGIDHTLNRHLGSWSAFEAAGKEESSSRIRIVNDHPSSFLQADHHQEQVSPSTAMQHKQGSVSGDHTLFNTPVGSLFNNHHNITAVSHENQFVEFQCFGKPWDLIDVSTVQD